MPDPKRSPAENLPWVPLATVVAGLLAGSWLLFQPLTSSRQLLLDWRQQWHVDSRCRRSLMARPATTTGYDAASCHDGRTGVGKRIRQEDAFNLRTFKGVL